jgi:hypothetical protein
MKSNLIVLDKLKSEYELKNIEMSLLLKEITLEEFEKLKRIHKIKFDSFYY